MSLLHHHHLLLQNMLCVSVGNFTWFANQCSVDHVVPRHFLVEILQTQQECSVSEPGHHRLRHPLQVHVAGEEREVRVGDGGGVGGWVTIRHQHVNQQLKQ